MLLVVCVDCWPPALTGALQSHPPHLIPRLPPSSYYGLTVWFPDMIRHLQAVDYAARTKVFPGERVEHVTFNFTLENQIHRGGQYFNDKYVAPLRRLSSCPFCCSPP